MEQDNVSCDADNNSVTFHVIADAGNYELPVKITPIKNLDGVTDETYATRLFYSYFEAMPTFSYDEDFQVGDTIVISQTLESNDENDEILSVTVDVVECESNQLTRRLGIMQSVEPVLDSR